MKRFLKGIAALVTLPNTRPSMTSSLRAGGSTTLSSQKPFGMPLGVSVGAASLDIARDSDFDHLFTRALRALERDVASVPA